MSYKPNPRHFWAILGLLANLIAPRALAGNPAHIATPPSNQNAGVGGSANFSVGVSGDPTVLYQWSFNGAAIAGATNSILSLPNVQATNQGSYQVVVTNNFGSDTSAVVTLSVRLSPAVTGWTHTATVAAGGTASFTVFTTGQPTLYYHWAFDGTNLAGATNSTLSIPNAQTTNAGSYQLIITNAYGSNVGPILTLAVTLPPVVTGSSSSGPALVGGTATFNVFVTGETPLLCQWYFNSGASSNALPNATNTSLSISNVQLTNAGSYQLFVTNSYGSTAGPVQTLTVLTNQPPSIGGNPVSVTAPQGFSASFQVFASGSAPLAYQWFFDGTEIDSATNSSLTLVDIQETNAGSYEVIITNAYGGPVFSSIATLTVPVLALQAPGVTMTPILDFDSITNGSQPLSSLMEGSDGDLYVTTSEGGTNDVNLGGDGAISKLDTNGNVFWTVSLSQTTGANPAAGLVQVGGGNFYGTAPNGGASFGTVFQITSSGILSLLYSFTNGADGAQPQASLALGGDGFLYGTASKGGTNDVGVGGDGTIFKMTTNGAMVWAVSLNKTDGRRPVSGLVQGLDGNFYGTTPSGGLNDSGVGGGGTVFQITTNGGLTSLFSFAADEDGGFPKAGLALGPDGAFYGTTTVGGNLSLNSGVGFGTVFNITTNGSLTTLAAFDGTNGASPDGALVLGDDFNLYGTTVRGGAGYPLGYGTVFRVTIDGSLSNLFSFNGNYDGAYPNASLVEAASGFYYGTTAQGGSNNLASGGDGTLFRISTPPGPPAIANFTNALVSVGGFLRYTNEAFSAHGPVTFSLGAGAPAGAVISPAGVFYWAPTFQEGNSINPITIWATDSSVPPLSNFLVITVDVGPCVVVQAGSNAVQIGMNTCVPIHLVSTYYLTNLSFTLAAAPNRFTNWSASAGASVVGSATVDATDPSQPRFTFTAASGKYIQGDIALGTVCVDALNAGDSAFTPLVVTNIVAITSSNALAGFLIPENGQLVLIADQPLLEASLGSRNTPALTLYGNPGTNYFIQYTTNAIPPITWFPLTNYILTGLSTNFSPASPSDQMELFQSYHF